MLGFSEFTESNAYQAIYIDLLFPGATCSFTGRHDGVGALERSRRL